MTQIKLHDKTFTKYLGKEEIEKSIAKVAVELNQTLKEKTDLHFLIVLKGAFMFSAELLKQITLPCEISFVSVSSYKGMSNDGSIDFLGEIKDDLEGKTVVIIEDIVDTGNTVSFLMDQLREKKVREIKVCSLLFKPDCFKKKFNVDYAAIRIPNDFVVGYGLDYLELGRNLPDIYQYYPDQP